MSLDLFKEDIFPLKIQVKVENVFLGGGKKRTAQFHVFVVSDRKRYVRAEKKVLALFGDYLLLGSLELIPNSDPVRFLRPENIDDVVAGMKLADMPFDDMGSYGDGTEYFVLNAEREFLTEEDLDGFLEWLNASGSET